MIAAVPPYREKVERVIAEVVASQATAVDSKGEFPARAVRSLGKEGLLGLLSAPDVGGPGEGMRASAWTGGRLAEECHFRDAQAATLMAPATDVLNDLIGKLDPAVRLDGR